MLPIGRRWYSGLIVAAAAVFLIGAVASCQHRDSGPPGLTPETRTENDADVLEREEMATAAATTMYEFIVGRLPGVDVRQIGGRLSVRIRGPSTVRGSSEALIVVDGVQSSGTLLAGMNPADVQRVEVLKGASAAVYGVRGANGVLLVTTRRPEE